MSGTAVTGEVARGTAARHRGAVIATQLRGHYVGRCVLLAAAYYAAAHLGYALRFSGAVGSVVWLPVGVGIVGLYFLGLQFWPAVVVGDLLVNNYTALPLGSAIGQSFGNLLEIVIAAALLRRLAARRGNPLSTSAGVAGMLFALAAGTIVSATIGSISLALGEVIRASSVTHVWATWWLGDFCGAVILVPLALAFRSPAAKPCPVRVHPFEAALLLITVVVLSTIAVQTNHDLSYIAFPALVWAALRFGPRGTTLAVAVCAAFTIWGATDLFGAFPDRSFSELLHIQLYLAVTETSALMVAGLACERVTLAQNLRASRARIVLAADAERRRLERDLHDGAQQRLVALSVRLGRMARATQDESDAAARSAAAAQAEVLEAVEEIRELVHGIRPGLLRRLGLARAVEAVAARAATPVEIVEMPEARVDETSETTAYYVLLEAVNNAERHAYASRIRVAVRLTRQGLQLEVDDDGVGGAAERGEFGLQGLRDRVEAIGGSFIVDSASGSGTRIRAEIPATVAPGVLA